MNETQRKTLFGESLASLLQSPVQGSKRGIPQIVLACVDFVLKQKNQTNDLFDLAQETEESKTLAQALIRAFREERKDWKIEENTHPFVVVLLLRYFISKLPDRLLVPEDKYPQLDEILSSKTNRERLLTYFVLFKELPQASQTLLKYLISFFQQVISLKLSTIQSVVKFWARSLGKPKTKNDLKSCAKIIVLLIKEEFSSKGDDIQPIAEPKISTLEHSLQVANEAIVLLKKQLEEQIQKTKNAEERAKEAEELVKQLRNQINSQGIPARQETSQENSAIQQFHAPTERLNVARKSAPKHRKSPSKNALKSKRDLEEQRNYQRQLLQQQQVSENTELATKLQHTGSLGLIAAVGFSGGKERLKKVPQEQQSTTQRKSKNVDSISQQQPTSSKVAPSIFSSNSPLPTSEIEQFVDQGNVLPRLIQIKGRLHIRCRVVELSWKSLNSGDVFILDIGTVLFLWQGSHSNRMQQTKALDICTRIKNKDRQTRANIIKLDENSEDLEFWNIIGGKHQIIDASVGGEDSVAGKEIYDILFKIEINSNDDNNIINPQAKEIGRNKSLNKEILDSFNCFILESESDVYVWLGSKANPSIRKISIPLSVQLLKSKPRIETAKVVKITEGMEPVLFKEKFNNWPDSLMIQTPQPIKANCTRVDMNFDTTKMLEIRIPPKETLPDDGNGTVKIWHMKEFGMEPVQESLYGQFFSGASYIILYSYKVRNRDCYIIFYWQGRTSTITDKGTSACLTIDLDEKYKNEAKQVRVVQNQEPLHFLTIFKTYIVHKGQYSSDGIPSGNVQLYHTTSFQSHGIPHAIQILSETYALNSNDSFIIQTAKMRYVWHGKHSPKEIREYSEEIAIELACPRSCKVIEEGSEQPDFWSLFTNGEKTIYFKEIRQKIRFFHCSNSSGKFETKELFCFSQEDLLSDDMAILDHFNCVFVWQGNKSNEEEKRKTIEVAIEYSNLVSQNRNKQEQLPVFVIQMGFEPPIFRQCFHGFDSEKSCWNNSISLIDARTVIANYERNYSLSELKEKPRHLDQTKLESYLSDAEFLSAFQMTKTEFESQSIWKKEQAKRQVGLY